MPYYSDTASNLQTCPPTEIDTGLASESGMTLNERRAAFSCLVTPSYVTGYPKCQSGSSQKNTCVTNPSSTQITPCGAGGTFWLSQTHSKPARDSNRLGTEGKTTDLITLGTEDRFHPQCKICEHGCGFLPTEDSGEEPRCSRKGQKMQVYLLLSAASA